MFFSVMWVFFISGKKQMFLHSLSMQLQSPKVKNMVDSWVDLELKQSRVWLVRGDPWGDQSMEEWWAFTWCF
jgi:hypothetical protein